MCTVEGFQVGWLVFSFAPIDWSVEAGAALTEVELRAAARRVRRAAHPHRRAPERVRPRGRGPEHRRPAGGEKPVHARGRGRLAPHRAQVQRGAGGEARVAARALEDAAPCQARDDRAAGRGRRRARGRPGRALGEDEALAEAHAVGRLPLGDHGARLGLRARVEV